MVGFDPELGFVSEEYRDSLARAAELQHQIDVLQESWDEATAALLRLRSEDEGWAIYGNVNTESGFSLSALKQVAKKAELQCVGNPLLKAAFELRFNPIFGRGFELEGDIKPRYRRKLDEPSVQEVLFEDDGLEILERTCFTTGNLFIGYNRITGEMLRIPFDQISNRAVDPDFPARVAYYQWSRTRVGFDREAENLVEWIPVVEWFASGKDTVDVILNAPVNHDWVIIDQRVNVPSSGHWGVPDVFPALGYAWQYSEYIRDASGMLKALNTIAWRLVGKTKAQAQAAGVALAGQRKAGGIAAMTAGTELTALPRAGQVDMGDGRPIAALVASSTGVSANALLSVVEGNGMANQTLDAKTVAMARTRQKRWKAFYARVFKAMGIEGVSINFPKISEDPIHRQVSSLAVGRAQGAVWADEYREAFMEMMSITPKHDQPPPVDEFAQSQNATGFLQMMNHLAGDTPEMDPIARQGNSGVSGPLGEIDNTNRNQDALASGGTQTDLVG